MDTNDIINGTLELFGGLLCTINIFRLMKDKQVKGVSWVPMLFFTFWGGWNLYYYPSLNQTFSFIGGMSVFASNTTWLLLVLHYHKKNKNGKSKEV